VVKFVLAAFSQTTPRPTISLKRRVPGRSVVCTVGGIGGTSGDSFALYRREATENAVRSATCFTTLSVCDKSETMNPPHAAALALVAWYLLRPPGPNNGAPDLSAPLSQWTDSGSFDSAKECERIRDSRTDLGERKIHEIKEKIDALAQQKPIPSEDNLRTLRENFEEARTFWMQYSYSQCVASDDPRLAK